MTPPRTPLGKIFLHSRHLEGNTVIAEFSKHSDPDPDTWANIEVDFDMLKDFYNDRFFTTVVDYPDHTGEHQQRTWNTPWETLSIEEQLDFVSDYISEGWPIKHLN